MNDIRKMSDIFARHSPANIGTIHTASLLEKVRMWLCIFILSAVISGCGDKPAPAKVVELTNISVSPTSLSFVLDGSPESQRIAATAIPEDATDVAFSWSSGNANIAAVSQDGMVIAKIAGSTTISAGKYQLTITTQFSGSSTPLKEPRTTVYEKAFTVQ